MVAVCSKWISLRVSIHPLLLGWQRTGLSLHDFESTRPDQQRIQAGLTPTNAITHEETQIFRRTRAAVDDRLYRCAGSFNGPRVFLHVSNAGTAVLVSSGTPRVLCGGGPF